MGSTQIRLTLDARVWKTGIGTYTLNLLSAIRRVDGGIRIKVIVRAEAVDTFAPLCDETVAADIPIYTVREQFQVPRVARGCDLLHVPHYNVPALYRGPMVATIHDVTHLTERAFRKTAKAWLYAWPMLQIAARKSSALITVSEYSKNEIVQRLGVRPEKIAVIYNGVSPRFRPMDRRVATEQVRAALAIDRPYVLYVGNLKPHKNLGKLIHAFGKLRSGDRIEHLLVLAGDDHQYRGNVLAESAAAGVCEAVRHVPWLSEEMLPSLYGGADLLVMPSTSEGFGLPVLEAMACGTPVACSRAASLPEVGGDAAIYFDPHNIEEMAAAIERVIDSPSLQEEMREKGLRQAARFTWEECARKHVEVYRAVLS